MTGDGEGQETSQGMTAGVQVRETGTSAAGEETKRGGADRREEIQRVSQGFRLRDSEVWFGVLGGRVLPTHVHSLSWRYLLNFQGPHAVDS